MLVGSVRNTFQKGVAEGCADIKVNPITGDVYVSGSSGTIGRLIRKRAAGATQFIGVSSASLSRAAKLLRISSIGTASTRAVRMASGNSWRASDGREGGGSC
jgi:hypothetical protein